MKRISTPMIVDKIIAQNRKHIFFALMLPAMALMLTACGLGSTAPTPNQETMIVLTAEAELTNASMSTSVEETVDDILKTATPSVTPTLTITPTLTFTATSTMTPTPTATPTATPTDTVTPTNTATPTATPTNTSTPTPTATPLPCNRAAFIKDVTVPDGTAFYAGTDFTKTWRLKNNGTCTWASSYGLVFTSGHQMDAPSVVKLGVDVYPGETVDVSVDLTAPATAGSYTGRWMLRDDNGVTFGINADAQSPIWVTIIVVEKRPDLDPNNPLDFTHNVRAAEWKSLAGVIYPGKVAYDFRNGSVGTVVGPKLEGGYQDDEPAIVVVPNDGQNGMIIGYYPEITIKKKDRFVALLGCMDDMPGCDVTFKLAYKADGGTTTVLQEWHETYDSKWTKVNIDLSFLAGKDVQFIFLVEGNDSSTNDAVFWLGPKIVR